ncbi:hypothetical protein HPB48_017657 [Haemaphysalis longicornis]|uniref:Uncharacterized protein n=1 Tax=Haemaphysalis longicornis TaxID=44386 RepID=A0A9J6GAG1_HAELO|nr:hypothetical protein HPB48_017657 [Haemaphysalis longicornis]
MQTSRIPRAEYNPNGKAQQKCTRSRAPRGAKKENGRDKNNATMKQNARGDASVLPGSFALPAQSLTKPATTFPAHAFAASVSCLTRGLSCRLRYSWLGSRSAADNSPRRGKNRGARDRAFTGSHLNGLVGTLSPTSRLPTLHGRLLEIPDTAAVTRRGLSPASESATSTHRSL